MFRSLSQGKKQNCVSKATLEVPTLLANGIRHSVDASQKFRKSGRASRKSCIAKIDEGELPPTAHAELLLEQVQEQENVMVEQLGEDIDERPLIALVAHDNMKPLMATFARSYATQLSAFRLTGTGTTCQMLRCIGLTPEDRSVPSGPLGGDQVLGGMIAEGEIKALFFFRDPLSAHVHITDIEALSRLADVYQIYFCTNYRTAAAVVENLHGKLLDRQRKQPTERSSIAVPQGMEDLGQIVQDTYKQTRKAIAKAAADGARGTPRK